MKKTLLAASVALLSNFALADTLPPSAIASEQSSGDNGFTYPSVTHLESDAIVNDIVFFYPSEMTDFFDGDMEEMVKYVNDSIEANNVAFQRQDIPLRRKVAGIVAIPSKLDYDPKGTRGQRIYDLRRLYNDDEFNYNYFYDTSYVSVLTPYYEEIVSSIGSAEVGGKFSWITPFRRDEVERTIAHELGHNDGFTHDKETYDEANGDDKSAYLARYAVGYSCGSFDSIMKSGSGSRDEGFFSSPLATNAQGVECGDANEGDSVRAYKDAVENLIPNQAGTFSNNKPSRAATGTATLSLPSTVINEGEDIVVEVFWAGAELGDSIQVLTRKGTADTTDFKSSLRSVYFDGNETTSRISIDTFDDSEFELDETMTIELIYPHGVSIEGEGAQVVTLTSDEIGNAGVVNFDTSRATVNEGQSVTLTLQRTGGTDGDIATRVVTEVGTANADDFTVTDREVIFLTGETSKTITISTVNDQTEEDAESFTVMLIGSSQIVGTSNEVVVTISASDAPASGGSNGSGNNTGSNAGGGGGGSMGIFSGLFLLLLTVARKKNVF